jgi:hypothetical protein
VPYPTCFLSLKTRVANGLLATRVFGLLAESSGFSSCFNLPTSTRLAHLHCPPILFCPCSFPLLSTSYYSKSFQSLEDFFPLALLTTTWKKFINGAEYTTHPPLPPPSSSPRRPLTGPTLPKLDPRMKRRTCPVTRHSAAHVRILSGLCFVSIQPPQSP